MAAKLFVLVACIALSHAAMVRRDAPPANTLLQDIEKHAAEFHKTFSEQLNSIANSKNTQEVNKAIKDGSDSVLQQLSALSSSLQSAMTDANAKAKTALEQARQNLEKTAEDLRKSHPDVEKQVNYINAHYLEECENLVKKPVETRRSTSWTMEVSAANERYYKDKLWPLGIVMYGYDPAILSLPEYSKLTYAMMVIELASCIVFKSFSTKDPLQPKNLLWFGFLGEEMPHLGFLAENQTLSISHMAHGAPGHTAHTINALMRALGIPMMSNRYDRDNYVTINWKNVAMMSEHHLERVPEDAWLRNAEGDGAPYDYDSVTHAPVNYMCADCSLGEQTVTPVQDHLWQRTLSMGHHSDLSPADKETLALLYNKECQKRLASDYKK